MTAPARELQIGRVGEVVLRSDAVPKATGEFAYASDLFAAGMLWGVTVRSPYAHARIEAIDVSEAVGMPCVHAVLTHDDVPGDKRYGLEFRDQPVLAFDRVRYHGEPVAVVAAEHPEQARRAAGRVRVQYEPLEAVTDVEAALVEGAPLVHEDIGTNRCYTWTLQTGEVEKAFADAAVTVSGRYRQNRLIPNAIEPRGVLVQPVPAQGDADPAHPPRPAGDDAGHP
jgi:CO/xanthine dehydrogenase Mo-binding subunit